MIPRADYHVHTTFCDGKNTPEEMVCAAIDVGMQAIGFSGHSNTAFDKNWCMSTLGTASYKNEISRLKQKYDGQIRILCGTEQDYYSDVDTSEYDYVIGAVHYLRLDGEYVPVDESAEILRIAAKKHCDGDILSITEAYYETVTDIFEKTHCDVIGHFDLISKFNEGGELFDETHPRYIAAWQNAANRILACGRPFEINTGAIFRGYRSLPYPSPAMQVYLGRNGAKFLLSSDAHSTDALCFSFEKWGAAAKEAGGKIVDTPCYSDNSVERE